MRLSHINLKIDWNQAVKDKEIFLYQLSDIKSRDMDLIN